MTLFCQVVVPLVPVRGRWELVQVARVYARLVPNSVQPLLLRVPSQ